VLRGVQQRAGVERVSYVPRGCAARGQHMDVMEFIKQTGAITGADRHRPLGWPRSYFPRFGDTSTNSSYCTLPTRLFILLRAGVQEGHAGRTTRYMLLSGRHLIYRQLSSVQRCHPSGDSKALVT
jgi:hypothetical protein